MNAKEEALAVINDLPEDVSFDRISEEIQIHAGIRRGLADVEAGRVKSHEQITKIAAGWRDKWNK